MAGRLEDRTGIVVGAGSVGPGWGNGKATAVTFAREGARVPCVDIDRAAAEHGCRPSILIQVDLAGETTKHGATVSTLPTLFDAAAACRAVQVRGLMLLPPFDEDPERVRPHFQRLRDARDGLRHDGVDPALLEHLSMGMSHDFEVAVQEGATLVRVGSAIFGRRPAPVPSV